MNTRSVEHYARVERERLLHESFLTALVRIAYEDAVAAKGTDAAALELLGYISQARPPMALAPPLEEPAPIVRRPDPKKGRPLSEEHRAKLRAASRKRWDAYRAAKNQAQEKPEDVVEHINGSIVRYFPAEL